MTLKVGGSMIKIESAGITLTVAVSAVKLKAAGVTIQEPQVKPLARAR